MQKKALIFIILLSISLVSGDTQIKLLKIEAQVSPYRIKQGKDGLLKLKIEPIPAIKIASHPELRIKLEENKDIQCNKYFFNSSELGFKTIKEEDTIFLEIQDKEIPITFKLKENALLGTRRIHGEVIFTAVFKDNWSLKTYQKFTAYFESRKNSQLNKNF